MDPTWQVVMDRIMGRLECLQTSQEEAREEMRAGQEEMKASEEQMKAMISASQEEIKDMINSIWSM
jgi:uncharacterized protein YaaN involved in tellurite resistance